MVVVDVGGGEREGGPPNRAVGLTNMGTHIMSRECG